MKFSRGWHRRAGWLLGLALWAHALTGAGWTTETPAARTAQHVSSEARKTTKAKAASPTEAPTPSPGAWEAFVDPERQIFPSLLLASATLKDPLRDDDTARKTGRSDRKKSPPAAHPKPDEAPEILGDENGLLGVVLANPADGAHARIEIKENALMSVTVLEAELPVAGRLYRLVPRVNYKYDALNRVRQSQPINVTFSVQVDGRSLGERFVTARVHPINDCPYAYENPDDAKDYVDIAWMFAAYVNEDHPAIPGLLKEAQATEVIDGFDAYQSKDPGTVLLQVFAVWEALRQHNIRYSDIGTTTQESNSLYCLHVRFIEEALSESHANCVDASALLASVLRRMGIDTFLVLEPGHMFLGIYLDAEGRQSACLETTMLGDPDPEKVTEHRLLAKAASRAVKKLKGWRCFNQALDTATREFNKHRKRFDRVNDPEYEIIDITAARREGIAPIGYVQGD